MRRSRATAGALGILVVAIITFFSREAVNDLRHHLTLWLVLAIAAVINAASFVLFLSFWALYRWIRRDLDAADEDAA